MIFIKTMKGMLAFGAGIASGVLYQKYNKEVGNMLNSLKKKQNMNK